jgi:NADH-ubiquinone oxidoreductase chain 5
MYLVILFLPLLSAILCGFFGWYVGHLGSMLISCSLVVLTFLLACFAFYQVGICGFNKYLYLFKWIDSGLFQANWSFSFDSLTVIMLVVVTGISSLVHIYSTDYMKEDPHVSRFMAYLSLFTFFMIVLVTGDNFIVMFVGWEGVGLCSYLLINFWYTRLQANKAAIKAMIMNRIGDIGLALGIFTIFSAFRALDYDLIFSLVPFFQEKTIFFIYRDFNLLNVISVFLFVGAIGKSAQLGLHTWLPDAMEGPTPVSALIHAATMVTAGVFLLVRCSPLYEYTPEILDVVAVLGASTAFFSATVGLLQNDLKRVIAYSTCSQLGYMIFACGVSNYAAGVFHLSNHAFFKALLFLSAGGVIHSMDDEQDMRRMGGLKSLLPYTYSMFLIGNLALIGFPYLSGFYSKDFILESAYAKYTFSGHFSYWLGTMAAFLTAFYSTRLMHMTFLSETNAYRKVLENIHEISFRMAFPLGILALFSIFVGYLTKDMLVGLGTDFWGNAIFVHPYHLISIDAEFVPFFVKQNTLIFSLFGAFSAYYFYEFFFEELFELKMSSLGHKIYLFFNRKWLFDKIIQDFITQYFMRMSYISTYKVLDKGFFELFGPEGITNNIYYYTRKTSEFYTGFLHHSSFIMLTGITTLLIFTIFSFYFHLLLDLEIWIFFFTVLIFLYTPHIIDFPEDSKPLKKRRRNGDPWTIF